MKLCDAGNAALLAGDSDCRHPPPVAPAPATALAPCSTAAAAAVLPQLLGFRCCGALPPPVWWTVSNLCLNCCGCHYCNLCASGCRCRLLHGSQDDLPPSRRSGCTPMTCGTTGAHVSAGPSRNAAVKPRMKETPANQRVHRQSHKVRSLSLVRWARLAAKLCMYQHAAAAAVAPAGLEVSNV